MLIFWTTRSTGSFYIKRFLGFPRRAVLRPACARPSRDTSPSKRGMHHETIGNDGAYVREVLDIPGAEIVLILKHTLFVH